MRKKRKTVSIHEYAVAMGSVAERVVVDGTVCKEDVYFIVGCMLAECSRKYGVTPTQTINEVIDFMDRAQRKKEDMRGESDE